METFVVDNCSVDGSVALVKEQFPWVKLIASPENLGFSKGNNLALRQCRGKYHLLLNPDTVVQEDTFHKCLAYMNEHPDVGGLGVQMVNGDGEFLPESKRGLPTPWVSFYKIFGLSSLFPNSKVFGRYHLGYLSKEENHEVDVLSGAFMLIRSETLNKVGLLDETFFMYGEDIDLSYRIKLGGWKNVYLGSVKIIHYKGESTKKGSLNYVKVFYGAMAIYANKYYKGNGLNIFIFLIRLAIFVRASIAMLARVLRSTSFVLFEFILFTFLIITIKFFWQQYIRKLPENFYPEWFDFSIAPFYSLLFVIGLFIAKSYHKPYRIQRTGLGVSIGFVFIVIISYLFKEINFSRGIVILSTVAVSLLAIVNRGWLNSLRSGSWFGDKIFKRRTIIVANPDELIRIIELLYQIGGAKNWDLIGGVTILPTEEKTPETKIPIIGYWKQIDEIISFYKIEEIIFCNASLSTQQIISSMARYANNKLEFKIVPPQADYLVGPNTILEKNRLS